MTASRHHLYAALSIMLMWTTTARAEDDRPWTIGKSSGEVWIATPGVQQASLSQQALLRPGDTIRTGRTGRVLLVRGEESIMIAPNSAIGIPQRASDGLSTTIAQQAGSILLEVEKRNVKHFEVETPYLAAVVKGTQFRISVDASGTHVDVIRGQVEVADFKSGQIAQIMPGQSAASFGQGKTGLSLSGSGSFGAIEQGQPRAAPIERLQVPRTGLKAPNSAGTGMRVLNIGEMRGAAAAARSTTAIASSLPTTTASPIASGSKTAAVVPSALRPGAAPNLVSAQHGLRISAPIGEVHLNFTKVTNGLARGVGPAVASAGRNGHGTIWSGQDNKTTTASQGNNAAGPNAGLNAATSVSASASVITPSVVSALTAASSSSSDIGVASSPTSADPATASSGTSGTSSGSGRGNSNGNGKLNGNGGSSYAAFLAGLAAAVRAELSHGNMGKGNGNNNGNSNGNNNNNGNANGRR